MNSVRTQASVTELISFAIDVRPGRQVVRQSGIDELRQRVRSSVRSWTRESVRDFLLPFMGALHNCPVVEGQGKAVGKLVLDSRARQYEAARKSLLRLTDTLFEIYPEVQALRHMQNK
jgi:hypothetical protein